MTLLYDVAVKDHIPLHYDPLNKSFLVPIWSNHCDGTKMRTIRRLAWCTNCDEQETVLQTATDSHLDMEDLRTSETKCVTIVMKERRECIKGNRIKQYYSLIALFYHS